MDIGRGRGDGQGTGAGTVVRATVSEAGTVDGAGTEVRATVSEAGTVDGAGTEVRATVSEAGTVDGAEPRSVRLKRVFYSHSMVAGGLLVTSRTTRLISGTSLVTRVEIRASTSSGSRAQSAVIASSLVTGRSTIGWP